jgi:tRNA(Ile)-lysidine synthase
MERDPDRWTATVEATIKRHALLRPEQTVVVAVSGGPDSTALLQLLGNLRARWNLTLIAAHLNHQLRGAEADADAAYVAELAERLGIPCRIETADVSGRRRRQHLSLQEAARQARHAFLRRIAEETGAERIALGHTRDDRAETVLLNILRGCGLEGLSGFPPARFPLIRPLYDLGRADTQACCAAYGLQPRQDSSNQKRDYRRNRARAELLPYLAAYFNADVTASLLRLADLAGGDNALLEQLAEEALNALILSETEQALTLCVAGLNAHPVALRRRIVRQAIRRMRGHLQAVGFETVETLLEAAAQGQRVAMTLPSGGGSAVEAHCEGFALRIATLDQSQALAWQRPVAVPGRTELPEAGSYLIVSLWPTTAAARREAALLLSCQGAAEGKPSVAIFRRRDVALPLLARSWQPGDRMRPRGLDGSKKLQDLFTDAKTPRRDRARFPVVLDAGGAGRILWVGGLRASETAVPLEPNSNEPEMAEETLLLSVFRQES